MNSKKIYDHIDHYSSNWWLYETRHLYPNNYKILSDGVPNCEKDNLLDFYYHKLCDKNCLSIWNFKWFLYENNILYRRYGTNKMSYSKLQKNRDKIYGCSRIMASYFKHCHPNIEENLGKITNIPTLIVHGRYDMLCPIIKADILDKKLKNSQLIICENSGHASDEIEIKHELLSALTRLKKYSSPLVK